jgi:hypothetical protein
MSKTNKRVSTLVIEVTGTKLPTWIFDAHLSKEPVNGINVRSMVEGDQVSQVAKLLDALEEIRLELPDNVQDLIDQI